LTTSPSSYSIDPAVASAWSNGQQNHGDPFASAFDDSKRSSGGRFNGFEEINSHEYIPRPAMVKRHTSHQNETAETRRNLVGPSVKRAALNRDNSMASNRLKAMHLPDIYNKNGKFDSEKEMLVLSTNMELSSLGARSFPKASAISLTERNSSADLMAMNLMTRPAPLTASSRSR